MGIIEKNKRTKSLSTKRFYFGAPEAEGENRRGYSLLDYFEDYLEVLDQLEQSKFIFTGRKGAGKSAIAKFIKDNSDKSVDSYASLLRISDFEVEKYIQETDIPNEQLLFEWLILVNIIKLIVKCGTSQYTAQFSKLKKFIENNSGMVSIDKYQFSEGLRKTGGEVSFGVLTHMFGGILKNHFDVKVTKAPFYKLIPALKDIVRTVLEFPVNKDIEYWLLFDDLDIGFEPNRERDNDRIMNLLRVAKEYNNEVFLNTQTRILVFLREDIKKVITSKYPDSAKIFSSYEVNINWYNHSLHVSNESENPLKRLVDKRIEVNLKNNLIDFKGNSWDNLFENHLYEFGGKSSFKYVLDHTFYRPRDLITILSIISHNDYTLPISLKNLRKIIEKYIGINVNEIKSELSLLFSESDKGIIFGRIFPFIADPRQRNLTYHKLIDSVEGYGLSVSSKFTIDSLIDYSLIIFKNQEGELFFNYRENSDIDRYSNRLYVTLPKCIYHYYNKIPN